MRKILIVVDMQNDFITGNLGTPEATGIVENVKKKIMSYRPSDVYATMDTHSPEYLSTQEGKFLPVEHCIKGTVGWEFPEELKDLLQSANIYEKPSFGYAQLAEDLQALSEKEEIEIEIVGVCTDICVISNALMLKSFMPEVRISLDSSCCAGVTPELHRAALETMKSCQIVVE